MADDDRSDLDVYLALAGELGASSVLDVGCGTGTFAGPLASTGREVIGVDPAAASLAVARAKPGADGVRLVEAGASSLPVEHVDLATMTGNVAQVFLADDEWQAALRGVAAVLPPAASSSSRSAGRGGGPGTVVRRRPRTGGSNAPPPAHSPPGWR